VNLAVPDPIRLIPVCVLCAVLACVFAVDVSGRNGRGQTIECPAVTLSASQPTSRLGEVVTFTATATDRNTGTAPISFTWTTTAGALEGSGNVVTLDTTGLGSGAVVVTVSVNQGDPVSPVTCSITVDLQTNCYWPTVRLPDLSFVLDAADLDHKDRLVLDDAALQLQSDPRLVLVVDGHSDAEERGGIALKRSEVARGYLVRSKSVDPNRIVVRSYDDTCPGVGGDHDLRIELWLLSEGATIDAIWKDCELVPTTRQMKAGAGQPGCQKYTVRRIEITGNTLIADQVVRRRISIVEGAPLEKAEVERSILGIDAFNAFEKLTKADVRFVVDEEQCLVDVEFALRARRE
jgi:outer membrane protein OmpA-like peptidoglycan-associated protein